MDNEDLRDIVQNLAMIAWCTIVATTLGFLWVVCHW